MAGTRSTTVGAVGGGDLRAAAEEIAGRARELAAGHGLTETAGRIEVSVSGQVATISVATGAAYPNEVLGVRHPTFGHDPWVTNQHRPFLGPAADQRAGAAMARYAQKIDRMVRARGFE